MASKSRGRPVKKSTTRTVRKARSSAAGRTTTTAKRARENVIALRNTLTAAGKRLHGERVLKTGSIVIRTAEGAPAVLALHASENGVMVETGGEHSGALLEVMGDPRRINAILNGSKDARMQFFAGGIRVRGDMHYLSELGMKLGFLKKPIV